ncbi:MAG: class I SAM-dependent methyltransferase, partial [Phycisphaerae bacterium]
MEDARLLGQIAHPPAGAAAIDLTCGSGYAAGLLAAATGGQVIGVDRSAGMLAEARANYPECEFVQADILEYLRGLEDGSVDVVTCCWGLGYSRPWAVLRQIRRVLRPGGRVGIIDNSLFSLREILACSFLAFAERPEALENLMRFRFLTGPGQLTAYFRLLGMRPVWSDGGSRTYTVASGQAAIERL